MKIEVEDDSIKEPIDGVLKLYFYRKFDGHEFFVPKEVLADFDEWINLNTESDEFNEHPGFDHLMITSSHVPVL